MSRDLVASLCTRVVDADGELASAGAEVFGADQALTPMLSARFGLACLW